MRLNTEKLKVVNFSCCPSHANPPVLKLYDTQLKIDTEAEFLGLILDQRLTWRLQIEHLVAKAQTQLNLLRALAALHSTPFPELILKLYRPLVRPIFEYSCIAFINASPNHIGKLQMVQNACLRAALKLPAYTPIPLLHDAAGVDPLKTHLLDFSKKRLLSLKKTSPQARDLINRFAIQDHIPHHLCPLELHI